MLSRIDGQAQVPVNVCVISLRANLLRKETRNWLTVSITKIGRAATSMGIRISVPLPATAHAQSFGRWLFA
jgi:hypothetical protein